MISTLKYYDVPLITIVKSFIKTDPWDANKFVVKIWVTKVNHLDKLISAFFSLFLGRGTKSTNIYNSVLFKVYKYAIRVIF